MNLLESLLTAFDSLLANKLRSLLTMLGVIIGVAAVIALMSLGNGFSQFINREIQSIGTNLIFITADTDVSNGALTLTLGDVDALADPINAPALQSVSGVVQGNRPVSYGSATQRTSVVGVMESYFAINNLLELDAGGLLTGADVASSARVAVLGYTIAADLFDGEFPIGKEIKINGISYEVVGVLTEKGGPPGASADSDVIIPLTTAQSRLFPLRTRSGERAVTSITAQAVSEDRMDDAVDQITALLRERHDIAYTSDDDFETFSQTDLLETFQTITGTLTLFLGAIAGISLLVGGIGIMNIMLVSVTERTREIGIRKAVGALQRDILAQFLIEALFLSLLGGVLGIALGFTISQVVGNFLDDVSPVIDIGTVLLATGFAAAVGLVFGIYPAWRAARLRPIEALRYE